MCMCVRVWLPAEADPTKYALMAFEGVKQVAPKAAAARAATPATAGPGGSGGGEAGGDEDGAAVDE